MSSLTGAQFEAGEPADFAVQQTRRELELLRRAQQGDRPAYGQLVTAYQSRLYNAVLRIVGDQEEARELTQEAFTRGLMKLESFRGDASPYTWLFRIAVNLGISRLRKVQRKRVFSLYGGVPGGGSGRDEQASGLAERLESR
jgi:DNA-directed RNA polymerase specialized sigma24 family protein